MGVHPQQTLITTSGIAYDDLDQAQMIDQDVRRNAMQAYIKHKIYYDEKANSSKLKEAGYVYVLQPKTDHHGSEIFFT